MSSFPESSGYGSGFGRSYGYAYRGGGGNGYGDGDGYGDGYGDGDGCGHGYARAGFRPRDRHHRNARFVGCIASFAVDLFLPFGVVSIGCQFKTIEEWRRDWRHVAADWADLVIDEAEVAELFVKAEELLRGAVCTRGS